jgi:hypothetical protein
MRFAGILDFGLFEIYQNGRQIGIQGYLIQTARSQYFGRYRVSC